MLWGTVGYCGYFRVLEVLWGTGGYWRYLGKIEGSGGYSGGTMGYFVVLWGHCKVQLVTAGYF